MDLDKTADARLIAPEGSPSIRYMKTNEAYDIWASVYDTDGNFLQALDTIEMNSLLTRFIENITSPTPWKLVDLGCGTGRNTKLLLNIPNTRVIGLDASSKMLDVARSRMQATAISDSHVSFDAFDLLSTAAPPVEALDADGIISTLVLEHVPISTLVAMAAKLLKPGGIFLLTNMHADMGALSQAGFQDPQTGDKIRPTSYAHRVSDVLEGARLAGFEMIQDVVERTVQPDMAAKLGPRAKKWVGVKVWFGVLFRKT